MADVSLGAIRDVAGALSGMLPRRSCHCEIPPPCWMPLPLGRVTSTVCPGGRAVVQVNVRNGDATPRIISVDTTQAEVSIAGSPLQLGPMQAGVVTVSVDVPAGAAQADLPEVLVWVRGCREHFLVWDVRVRGRGLNSCHEVEVADAPDLIHHWYDHFYCQRGCPHGSGGITHG